MLCITGVAERGRQPVCQSWGEGQVISSGHIPVGSGKQRCTPDSVDMSVCRVEKKKNQNEMTNETVFTKFKNTCLQNNNTWYARLHIQTKRCSLCPLYARMKYKSKKKEYKGIYPPLKRPYMGSLRIKCLELSMSNSFSYS